MDLQNKPDLLIKFYANKCSFDEYVKVMDWLSDEKNQKEADQIMKHHWHLIESVTSDKGIQSNKMWEAISNSEEFNDTSATKVIAMASRRQWALGIAASVALLMVCSFIFFLMPAKSKMLVVQTQAGERRTILLPDSSVVRLNVNSRVSFPAEFDSDQRLVSLQGEAFFEVTANPSYPFIVEANGIHVKAYGTQYNVRARDSDLVAVALTEGKVRVDDLRNQSINMKPGDLVTYEASSGELNKSRLESKSIAWREGILVIDEERLKDAITQIEDWYNVRVDVTGEVPDSWRFSGKFDNKKLDDVLTSMAYVHEFDFRIQDSSISIKIKE